ncbi:unnamed protein product [Spirodela intermedia]|uniref:C2H2-type domain-containing protein n=1 Tax=Spirodela intermedia TaxID=51605 RepID=A0A7I8IRY6_SPIIN|nr:unnamed protein product [Spirodela intermedia]CAA6660743.1 unnamed protein product [Spirodela intermedia]
MAQSGDNAAGVDNTFRKKWNREEYLERAREREKQEEESRFSSKAKAPPIQRKPLKHRDYEVDLSSRLGKTQVVTPIAPLSQQAGYYCPVCECVVKDSANYLDHINGKNVWISEIIYSFYISLFFWPIRTHHQRALGMSMRVERASLQQVQERFEVLKKRKVTSSFSEQDLDERILKQQNEEEERRRQRRERKKEKKKEKAVEDDAEDADADIAAMMGFGGFRSSKK